MIDPYRLQGNFSHKRHCESVLGRQITRHRSTLASDHADTDSQVWRAALDQSQGGLLAVSLSGTMSYTSTCTLTWSGKRGWISSTRQSRGGLLAFNTEQADSDTISCPAVHLWSPNKMIFFLGQQMPWLQIMLIRSNWIYWGRAISVLFIYRMTGPPRIPRFIGILQKTLFWDSEHVVEQSLYICLFLGLSPNFITQAVL